MVIGLAGSFGAGKGEVVNYLTQKKDFKHISARELITKEIKKRELPLNRDSMILVGNDIRAKGGPSHLYELLFAEAKKIEGNVVVESIRAVAEVKYTKEQGGVVIGVDADPKLRYERATHRGSESDNVTFEKWRQQEMDESNPDDPTKQDIFGSLREADFIIQNNSTIEDLHKQIEKVLKEIES